MVTCRTGLDWTGLDCHYDTREGFVFSRMDMQWTTFSRYGTVGVVRVIDVVVVVGTIRPLVGLLYGGLDDLSRRR